MPGKEELTLDKRIRLADIVRDIEMGLGDVPIMEKYGLRPMEYVDILERVKSARLVDERHFEGRIIREEGELLEEETRMAPRCYLVASVGVEDLLDSSIRGELVDLTENGCRLRGIQCNPGETRRFRVTGEDYPPDTMDCRFAAQCRWGTWDPAEGGYVAGYEIQSISEPDKTKLRTIIRLLSICDE